MTRTPTAKLALSDAKPAAIATDALLVGLAPTRSRKVEVLAPGLPAGARAKLAEAFAAVGATGKPGNVAKVPGGGAIKATMVVGVGVGDAAAREDAETVRRAVGDAVRSLAGTRRIAIALPIDDDDAMLTVSIAALLAAYDHIAFRGISKKDQTSPVSSVTVLLPAAPTAEQKQQAKGIAAVAAAVNLTRDLVNTPAGDLPPSELALAARDAVADLPVEVTIWDEQGLAELECGGILGVGKGSANPPRLTRLSYSPDGAKTHLALVGKGITFDTGGISIKPAQSMHEMKSDMAGAAAVVGAVRAIAELGLPIKVTGWMPSAENMPSGKAQRPGDVLTIRGGTTVEVLNTDAEGRLVLADALVLAAEEKPDLIIDVATLTGAAVVALGPRLAGVMSNDPDARTLVCEAASAVGEDFWPMPLPKDLRAGLDSPTADIANVSDRFGGMLTAGLFLQEFIPSGQSWVHVDIAGPSYNDKGAYGYTPHGGTGAAVRAFVQVAGELANG